MKVKGSEKLLKPAMSEVKLVIAMLLVKSYTTYGIWYTTKVTDLATTNPVSHSYHYCSTPSSLDPERLLKKREA